MPTYTYACSCGATRDVVRGFNVPEEFPICTDCHNTMIRHWSAPTVVFNGSGFYSTDNRK